MYAEYPQLGEKLAALNLGDYLEFGCGSGGFLGYVLGLNQSATSITAVDISQKSVEAAKAELASHDIKYIVQEQLPLNIPDQYFSAITLSNTLHHLRDKTAVFSEFKRLLKPDGKLIITEMVSDGLRKAEQSYFRFHSLRAMIDQSHGVFHDITYTSNEIQQMISTRGTHIERMTIIPNEKQVVTDAAEIDEMVGLTDEMIAPEHHSPDFPELKKSAEAVKGSLNQHGIKRPPQLYLELTF